MFSLQVQEALDAPSDPGGVEQTECEVDSYPQGWREQESDSSHEPRNDEDGFSALLGEEQHYQGLDLENGYRKLQGGVRSTHCREQEIQRINTLSTEEKELNRQRINTHFDTLTAQDRLSVSVNGLNTAELNAQLDQGTGELNTQHVNACNAKHTAKNNTEELKTHDTENTALAGKACIEINRDERAGKQPVETKDENIEEEKRSNGRQSLSTKYCGETYLKVSTCSQRTDLFSLNDFVEQNLENTSIFTAEVHKNVSSTINTQLDRLHNTDDKHTCKPEIHSDSREVEVRDTGVHSCSLDSDLHHKYSNNLDTHCPETFIDTEGTTCFQHRNNIKSGCINIKHKASPSQDDVCNGKRSIYKADELDLLSRSQRKRIHCNENCLHTHATSESTNTSGEKGKALNTAVHCKDPLIVFTTCRDCNIVKIEPSNTEEYCSTYLTTWDGDTKPHDTLCVSDIHALHLGTESVNSPGLPHPLSSKLLPACSEETAAAETILHTGAEKQLQKSPHDQQQALDSKFLPCSTDYEDVDGIFWLNSSATATKNKSTLSYTGGYTQFVAREGRRNSFKEKVWEDSSFPLTLSPLSTSEERLAESLTLLQVHNKCKDINSHSPELLISSSRSCDQSHYSLSTEEKVKDQSQELTRSEEVEGSLYPKHGQSIEEELHPPFHSAKSNHSEIKKENCVSSKPVETPLFTVCQPTHTHEQCVNALNNHTLFIDLKHKRSISFPSCQGNDTEIPFPETSTIKTVEDSKASFVEKDNSQSDHTESCWNLTVYNSTASERSAEAKEAVGVCNPWLEPFSDGPESDSEDSDQTNSFCLTFHQNQRTLPRGLFSLGGLQKRSDVLFPADWSSEDSAVSGLGEDLESIHCELYPPLVENSEQPTLKEHPDTCLHSECSIVNTDNKLHSDQKCHLDSQLIQSVPNGLGPFIHSGQCKDNSHTHIHNSLCGYIQETRDIDLLSSQIHQPCIEVLKSSSGYLETENPITQDNQKELSSPTRLKSHSGIKSYEEKKDSSLSLSEVKAICYAQTEVLLSSRILEPIPEKDCSLDSFPNPNDVTFLGDTKPDTEKFGSEKMKPSESDQDLLGVTSSEHHLSVCKGN